MLKKLLHIIRWPNLLMVAGIQILVYYKLMDPPESVMSWADLLLLTVVTMMIGASGYIINDFYDAGTDRINKPEKWIAGHQLSMRTVKILYFLFVLAGFVIAFWLALRLGLIKYIFIYPLSVAGLWFYSYALKCRPVTGNIWVSLFCAGVIGSVALPDFFLKNTSHLKPELWYYVAFAFIATWFREIVKDIEDLEGDTRTNCRTAIVSFGLKAGKFMALAVGLLLIIALLLWDSMQTHLWIKLILTILQGFTAGSMAFLWWAKNKTYYHYASMIIKFVMVGGTLILIFV